MDRREYAKRRDFIGAIQTRARGDDCRKIKPEPPLFDSRAAIVIRPLPGEGRKLMPHESPLESLFPFFRRFDSPSFGYFARHVDDGYSSEPLSR